MHFYFAYGSNLDLTDMARWAHEHGHAEPAVHAQEVGVLDGYRLCWNYFSKARDGGAANLCAQENDRVAGSLCWVSKETLHTLDRKEGHPHRYERSLHEVQSASLGTVRAWVYRVRKEHLQDRFVPPKADYLDLMLRAAERANLPQWHLATLQLLARDLKEAD